MNNKTVKIPAITLGASIVCAGTVVAINEIFKLYQKRKSKRGFIRVNYLYTKEFE
jgi:ketopantoate hydroxymethyltransferase